MSSENNGPQGAIQRAIDNGQITNDLMVSGSNEYNRITIADTYTKLTRETAIYPGAMDMHKYGTADITALAYVGLGLAGEAGEVANKIKKIIRDNDGHVGDDVLGPIAEELGDVFWYLFRLCDEIGADASKIMAQNINKLFSRKKRGVIGGSGDNR